MKKGEEEKKQEKKKGLKGGGVGRKGRNTENKGEGRNERLYKGGGKQENKGREEEKGKKETWEEEKT